MKRLLFLPLLLIAVSAWAIPREPVTGPGGIVGPPGIPQLWDITLTTTADTPDPITINTVVSAGETMTVDWGDGTSNIVTGTGAQVNTTHDYPGSGGAGYRIKIRFSDITKLLRFHIGSQKVAGNLKDFKKFSALATLFIFDNSFYGDLVDIPINIYSFWGYSTRITGSTSHFDIYTKLGNLQIPSAAVTINLADFTGNPLIVLRINNTNATGDISALAGITTLTTIQVHNNLGLTYTQGTLPSQWDACNINISGIGLTSQEVDDFLCDLDTASVASTKTLTIKTGNDAQSAAGDACEASLELKGRKVN